MNEKTFALINKYAKALNEEEGKKEALRIYLKTDEGIFATAEGSDFGSLTIEDVNKAPAGDVERKILSSSKEYSALIVSKTPYCSIMRESGRTVIAALDDMAQIVGAKVVICPYKLEKISAALKKSTACMVEKKGTITVGRSLFEAKVALDVLEKSANINLSADILGGIKPISAFDAKLMRIVYKKKYSKSEAMAKSKEGR